MARTSGDSWVRELDYLRAFAILGIVAIHVGSFSITIDDPGALGLVTGYIAHLADFGIPLFFIISGFVLALRYYDRNRRGGFYRRRLRAVVPPYLAFSTLYLAYGYAMMGETSLYRAAWSYLLFDATGIFWFLAVIIQMYLLFPYLATWMGVLEAKGQAWKAPVLSAVLYVAWYAFLGQEIAAVLGSLWQPVPGFGGIVADRLFPGFLLFFVIGMYLARRGPSSRDLINSLSRPYMVVPLLAGGAVLQALGGGFWWWMAMVPYSLVASALLLRLSRWLAARPGAAADGLELIGRYSFGLYLAHILVMAVVVNRLWAVGLGAGNALFYVLLYVLTIGAGVVGLWTINLLPFGPYITGVRKAERKKRRDG